MGSALRRGPWVPGRSHPTRSSHLEGMLYLLPAALPGCSCAAPNASLPTSSPSRLPALLFPSSPLRPFPTLFLLASVLFLSMSREFPAWLLASTFGQKAAILEGDVISHPLCWGRHHGSSSPGSRGLGPLPSHSQFWEGA